MKTSRHAGAGQRGAALFVALIFLLVLTLLGTTATTNNSLQERMAGHTRDRDLSFQAAEHALAAADDWIRSQTLDDMDDLVTGSGVSCTDQVADDGIRCFDESNPPPNDSDYWRNSFNWASADLLSPPTGQSLGHLHAQPLYVIERMPDYTDLTSGDTYRYYRVTARGVGGSGDAIVILQAMYRMKEE